MIKMLELLEDIPNIDYNSPDLEGTTPLHFGAQVGYLVYPPFLFQTPASHLCGNGMIEMLELLEDIPNIDYNSPDSEGNTPLHFGAQAGHVEVVSFLLNKVRTIQVDPVNKLGFTPLMKASLQGRIKCSKLLLFSGRVI